MLTVEKYASGTKPRMESRVRGNVQARFGEGDTPYPQGSTVPTLPMVRLLQIRGVLTLLGCGPCAHLS